MYLCVFALKSEFLLFRSSVKWLILLLVRAIVILDVIFHIYSKQTKITGKEKVLATLLSTACAGLGIKFQLLCAKFNTVPVVNLKKTMVSC